MPRIRLPSPHLGQKTIIGAAQRFNWLSAGRRWRKTTLGVSLAVDAAAHGSRILWGAPTYDQVRVAWDETQHGVGTYATFTRQRMIAEFPAGGAIVYRSLDDPDRARGHTADGVIIDEVGDVKGAAYYEVIRPMLIDTGGWLWALGTPRGHNWFWIEHRAATDRADSVSWQVPTLGCRITADGLIREPHPLENPTIEFAEILDVYSKVPEITFRQEILAEFVDDTSGVFRYVNRAASAVKASEAVEDHAYAFGVDWGKFDDFTVIAVIDTTDKALVFLDRFNRIDYAVQSTRLQALADRFKPIQIIAERNAMGEPIIEQLRRMGLPVRPFLTTNASKASAIEALALAFERSDITIINDPVLIGELQAYTADRLPSGLLRYNAPSGMHDDCVMALALAWQSVARQSMVFG